MSQDQMKEVTPHVTSLHVELKWFPQPYPPNVFLIKDAGEGLLIDAGFSDDDSFKQRMEFLDAHSDVTLKYILLTHHHYDHSSGAQRLREATGAEIVLHVAEEKWLLSPEEETGDIEIPEDQKEARERAKQWREEAAKAVPDIRVEDDAVIKVGGFSVQCLHTPGHTAGHLCFYLPEDKTLFAGDNVLGVGTAAIPPPPHGDMGQYVESLRRMKDVDADLLLPGHGPGVKEPQRKIQELIDHRQQREDQILRLLADGRDSVKSLVKAIYPELDKRLLSMAQGQVLSHLHKLQSEGKLRLEGKGADTTIAMR
jgi:glyoxylase-like metal-dependent hydrolase (beta-lactamase superfamily II)